MNKHINRAFRVYKDVVGLDKNNTVKLAERDHMPREVATEMLLTRRMSNRERKAYMAARWKCYESIFQAKPVEDKLIRRMRAASWNQLIRWNKRAIDRRADVQTAYLLANRRRDALSSQEVDPKNEAANMKTQLDLALLNRAIAGLEVKAAQLDLFWSAVDEEITRRRKFFAALEKVTPSIAKRCSTEESKGVSC